MVEESKKKDQGTDTLILLGVMGSGKSKLGQMIFLEED